MASRHAGERIFVVFDAYPRRIIAETTLDDTNKHGIPRGCLSYFCFMHMSKKTHQSNQAFRSILMIRYILRDSFKKKTLQYLSLTHFHHVEIMNESRFKMRQKNFFEVAVSIVLRTSKLPRKKITASVTETIYFRTLTAQRSAHKAAICEGSLRHYKNQSKTNSIEP